MFRGQSSPILCAAPQQVIGVTAALDTNCYHFCELEFMEVFQS